MPDDDDQGDEPTPLPEPVPEPVPDPPDEPVVIEVPFEEFPDMSPPDPPLP